MQLLPTRDGSTMNVSKGARHFRLRVRFGMGTAKIMHKLCLYLALFTRGVFSQENTRIL